MAHNPRSASFRKTATAIALSLAAISVAGPAIGQTSSILDLLKEDESGPRTLREIELAAIDAEPGEALKLWREALEIVDAGGETAKPVDRDRILEAIITAALALAPNAGEDAAFQDDDQREPLALAGFAAERLSTPLAMTWGLTDIAKARMAVGENVRARALLRRAADTARRIEEKALQGIAQVEIVEAALAAGGGTGFAELSLLRMTDPQSRANAAALTARAQLAAGETEDEALSAAAATIGEDGRNERLAEIALDRARAGAFRAAALIAIAIDDADLHGDAAEELVEIALKRGDVPAARRFAVSVADHGSALKAWSSIASALDERGYAAQADAALGLAIAAAAQSGDADDFARASVAAARIGRTSRARRILDRAADASVEQRDRAFAEIARNLARDGELGEASGLASLIADAKRAARVWSEIGVHLARKGSYDEALSYANRIEAGKERDRILRHAAKGIAEAGDIDRAAEIARSVDTDAVRVDALSQVARAAQRNRSATEADSLFAEAEAALSGSAAAAVLVSALADGARFEAAYRILSTLKGGEERTDATAALVEPLLNDNLEAGLLLLEEIKAEGADIQTIGELTSLAAQRLQKTGSLREALELIRGLDDYSARVLAYRDLAEIQAASLDDYGLFEGGGEGPALAKDIAISEPTIAVNGDYVASMVSSVSSAKSDAGDAIPGLGRFVMPPLPDFSIRTEDVRAAVPPIAPGGAAVALMRYSQYNQKFITDIPKWEEHGRRQGKQTPEFIFVETGVFDLASLKETLDGDPSGRGALVRDGEDVYVLRLPILIGPEATLVVQGGVDLRLSADSGVYVVNAGGLHLTDARIIGWNEEAGAPAIASYEDRYDFRPFITTWSGGTLYAANAAFVALGYQYGKSYGVSFSAGPNTILKGSDDEAARPTGAIVDSSFEEMYYAFYSYEADHVELIGNELKNNIVYGLDPHDRSRWLKIAYNTAYGTKRRHGIIISREVDETWIAGNTSFDNNGTGIMVDRDSIGSTVYANTTIDNRQEGITYFESSCALIVSNLIADNDRAGLKIRNSWDVGVVGNRIDGNVGAGVEAYVSDLASSPQHSHRDFPLDPYETVTSLTLAGNVIGGNGVGLAFDGVDSALIGRNQWINQAPKLFSPSIGQVGPAIIATTQGDAGVAIVNRCADPRPAYACPFMDQGYLNGDGRDLGSISTEQRPASCAPAANSSQEPPQQAPDSGAGPSDDDIDPSEATLDLRNPEQPIGSATKLARSER